MIKRENSDVEKLIYIFLQKRKKKYGDITQLNDHSDQDYDNDNADAFFTNFVLLFLSFP